MGKLHKEGDGTSGLHSKSIGRKRDLKWKMMYTVMVMGLIGLLQLVVVEHLWYWPSSGKQFASTPLVIRRRGKALQQSQLALHPDASSQSSTSQPCASGCDANNHSVELQQRQVQLTVTKPLKTVKRKNAKLIEFKAENTFFPMKDVTQLGMSNKDTNWFMSRLRGSTSQGNGETFDLPQDDPEGRVLCVRGNDRRDGTKNSYGLFRQTLLPPNSIFLDRTTFIAENYWDYNNPWHAMSALANFATWRMENRCSTPERLLLYHTGELVASMGAWITNLLEAAFVKAIPIETLRYASGVNSVCFQRAVIQRRGLGNVDKAHMNALFDMLRCKARRYCGKIKPRRVQNSPRLEVLLFTRSGPRAFTNETAVAGVVHNECSKIPGCNLRVVNSGNLTFCEQVEVMSRTDVLITVHGAQMTNMMFLSPGSRVMELFPKGWLEFAGVGQEIYKWHADWTRVIHEGRWRDPEGPECPYPAKETLKCLLFFKDREVGLNASHLAQWTRTTLVKHLGDDKYKESWQESVRDGCACDEDDDHRVGNSATNSFQKKP